MLDAPNSFRRTLTRLESGLVEKVIPEELFSSQPPPTDGKRTGGRQCGQISTLLIKTLPVKHINALYARASGAVFPRVKKKNERRRRNQWRVVWGKTVL